MGSGKLLRQAKDRSFKTMINNPDSMKRITYWIFINGWFEQFRLAEEVEIGVNEMMMRSGK